MAFQCPPVPHRDGVSRLLSRVPAHRSRCPPLRTPAPADHGAGCRIGCDHLPAVFLHGPSLPPVPKSTHSTVYCLRVRGYWHTRANPRPGIWLRIDLEGAVHLVDSFSHADQPHSAGVLRIGGIKPHTLITDLKLKVLRLCFQTHLKMLFAAIFYCVVDGLLDDSEHGKRHLPRHGVW